MSIYAAAVLAGLTYSQRLKVIDLESLELRRLYADLIMCYKIVFGLANLTFSDFLHSVLALLLEGTSTKSV